MARDITKLHPKLQTKVKELQELCEKNGLKIGISECVRTVAEQDALYAKGRTAAGSVVTNAKGSSYSSMHQWGVAFDFYRNDGKGAYNDSDGFFSKVGKLGQSIGLEWGGGWKSIVDKPHFQLSDWGSTTSKLKSLYKTPEDFMKTWKAEEKTSTKKAPSLAKAPLEYGAQGSEVKKLQKDLNYIMNSELEVSGIFDKPTKIVVKKFQKKYGLVIDGSYGEKTKAKMASLLK